MQFTIFKLSPYHPTVTSFGAKKASKKGPKATKGNIIEFTPKWIKGYADFYQQRKDAGEKGNGAISLALYLKGWIEKRGKKSGWLPSSSQIAEQFNKHVKLGKPIAPNLVRRALDIAGTLTGRVISVPRKGYQVGHFQPDKLPPQLILNAGVILAISKMKEGKVIQSETLEKLFGVKKFPIKNALSVAEAMGYIERIDKGFIVLKNESLSTQHLFQITNRTEERLTEAKARPKVIDRVKGYLEHLDRTSQAGEVKITAKQIAQQLQVSVSSVSNALKALSKGKEGLVKPPKSDNHGHTLVRKKTSMA